MNIQERMNDVLRREAEAIGAVRLNRSAEQAVIALRDCAGKVVATGMGKAGLIARKFASILCSTGSPAAFIEAGEAAHGDLGLIAPGDCLVAFSTSGKTREVLEMIDLGRRLGLACVIGITSHPDSGLRTLSDIVIDMGEIEEPCPLGLTPSASIAVMSAISDALALALLEHKGITREDYGLRHHGGYLGQRARTQGT